MRKCKSAHNCSEAQWACPDCFEAAQTELGELDAQIIFLKKDYDDLKQKADKLAEALETILHNPMYGYDEDGSNHAVADKALKEYRGEE